MILKNNELMPGEWLPDPNPEWPTMVYEVLRIKDRQALFLREHVQRLFRSLELAKLESPMDPGQVEKLLAKLIESDGRELGNLTIRLVWNPEPFIEIGYIPHHYPTERESTHGVPLATFKAVRKNPNAKTWNPGVRLLANKLISELKVYEVILLNDAHLITEGSRSNIFWVKNGQMHTPPLASVLPGITRQKVINLANDQNLPFSEKNLPLDELFAADEVFITGTSPGVLPVALIDQNQYSSDRPITMMIQKAYQNLLNGSQTPQNLLANNL